MLHSETARELISLAFDNNPADSRVTLADALDLFAMLVTAEVRIEYGLKTAQTPAPTAEPEPSPVVETPPEPETTQTPPGRGGKFKAEVLQRLKAYRKANGLGSFAPLAKAANGAITEDEMRGMIMGDAYPLAKWKALDAVLAYCGG